MKNRWHTLRHWEYWPVQIVYFFTGLYWVFWAIRLRSISFYKYANPAIPNGGLFGDSKFGIYSILPNECCPQTILVSLNQSVDLESILRKFPNGFPLVLKPDVGCRGIGVQKVDDMEQWRAYHIKSKQDYLVQQWIAWPKELSLFYCRFPNASKGKIVSLTLKEFLTVEGDGHSSIRALLELNPRHRRQVKKLSCEMNLDEVLPRGEKKCVVPYGNHNRGTMFLDGRESISEKLESTFDGMLHSISGFYYGRLDIRYHSLTQLERGENFSIIELNGAKSEPTHIYDPKHSFCYGQREIGRHQRLMVDIVRASMRVH